MKRFSRLFWIFALYELRVNCLKEYIQKRMLNYGDAPEYEKNINILMSYSAAQTYIQDSWKLPHVTSNPSLQTWIYDESENVIVTWCTNVCHYMIMSIGNGTEPWTMVKAPDRYLEYLNSPDGEGRQPLLAGDARIYRDGNKLVLTYVDGNPETRLMVQKFGDLSYNASLDCIYILLPATRMSIDHEVGVRHQKNWSPFIFEINDEYRENLFIYGVHPHRIVFVNESIGVGVNKVHTVAMSEFKHQDESQPIWSYGEPRGGTPAVLIDTKYGPRYLTFFHSQCKCSIGYILTYYFGAYLFDVTPPFAISHWTPTPIIPKPLYDESNGWAFKAIDYIVFPIGLLARGDTCYVTMGRNDNSGWVVKMNVSGLVDSMVAVKSKTILNKFSRHVSYELHAEDRKRRKSRHV